MMTTRPADLRQQPGVCPECKGTRILYNDTRPVDCDVCEGTGQQPAQPGSGKAVKLYTTDELIARFQLRGGPVEQHLRSLQSTLTEAQRENAALRNLAANLQPGPISEALPCSCGFMDAVKDQGNG